LDNATPFFQDNDVRLYAAAAMHEINTEAIIYFAMSVFWRASVHRWVIGGHPIGITLGPYEEPLRRFLVNETDYPDSMSLTVLVGSASKAAELAVNPISSRQEGIHCHRFSLPGLTFLLFVGSTLTTENVALSMAPAPEGFIWIYPAAEENHIRERLRLSPRRSPR
jgi:hypothetical protein